MRGDLILMYKIRKGLECIQWHIGPNGVRVIASSDCLGKSKARNDFGHFVYLRQEFFVNRVVLAFSS